MAIPLSLVLLAMVILMQQTLVGLHRGTLTKPTAWAIASEKLTPPGIDGLTLLAKQIVKAKAAGVIRDKAILEIEQIDLDQAAVSRTERLRVAIVCGELLGKERAEERLKQLSEEFGPDSGLAEDVRSLRAIYQKGVKTLKPEAADALVERHGWFGHLALGFGAGEGDDHRRLATSGYKVIAATMFAQGVLMLATFCVAMVSLFAVIAKVTNRSLDSGFDLSGLPPGIYLEVFMAFLALFLFLVGVQVMTLWMTGVASVVALVFNEILLWLMPLCALWPMARGVKWTLILEDLGWTSGESVAKEILIGIAIFLACMPINWGVAWVIRLCQEAFNPDGAEEGLRGFPTFEPPLVGSWIPIVLGTIGAVVWAPVLEETVFRGALYRYIRGRLGVAAAVLLSAAAFGAIHPYGISGIISVGISGVAWALVREWRGSIIACVVGHMLHNGMISAMQVWTILAIS